MPHSRVFGCGSLSAASGIDLAGFFRVRLFVLLDPKRET